MERNLDGYVNFDDWVKMHRDVSSDDIVFLIMSWNTFVQCRHIERAMVHGVLHLLLPEYKI